MTAQIGKCIKDVGTEIENLLSSVVLRHLLCHHDQFQMVFVTPDRTQLECEKHKRLVTEFKKRRFEGESGLVINNAAIIVRAGTVPQGRSHNE